eukprot:10313982-Alexandrium_andersonii.AAC.1
MPALAKLCGATVEGYGYSFLCLFEHPSGLVIDGLASSDPCSTARRLSSRGSSLNARPSHGLGDS